MKTTGNFDSSYNKTWILYKKQRATDHVQGPRSFSTFNEEHLCGKHLYVEYFKVLT